MLVSHPSLVNRFSATIFHAGPKKSPPPPETIDRNVIYIQVPRRDAATRTAGVVSWIISIVNSLSGALRSDNATAAKTSLQI